MKSEKEQSYEDSTSMSQEEKILFLDQLFVPQSEKKPKNKNGLDFSAFIKASKNSFKRRRTKSIHLNANLFQSLNIINTQYYLITLIVLFIIYIGYLNRALIFSITPFLLIMYLFNLYLFNKKTPQEKYKDILGLKLNESTINTTDNNNNNSDNNIDESELEQCLLLNI